MRIFLRSVYASAFITIAFIVALYLSDSKHRESGVNVGIGVMAGILSAFFVLIIRTLMPTPFGIYDSSSLLAVLDQSFFRAGFLEELIKYLFFFVFFWNMPFEEFPEKYDGMLYFGSIGGGFALYEDFLYIFSRTNYFWQLGKAAKSETVFQSMMLYRSFPGHILFGALAGYFIGKARFSDRKITKLKLILFGFVAAVVAHGTFNTMVHFSGEFGALVFTMVLIWLIYSLRDLLLGDSPFAEIESFESSGILSRWEIIKDWKYNRSFDDYAKLKKDKGSDWTIGLLPVFLSLTILFPLLIGGLYMLNQAAIKYLPPIW